MSLLQRLSHSRPDGCRSDLPSNVNKELEAAASRYEPLALGPHRLPIDPYAAWLAQREAAREPEGQPHIRCVYRYGGTVLRRS